MTRGQAPAPIRRSVASTSDAAGVPERAAWPLPPGISQRREDGTSCGGGGESDAPPNRVGESVSHARSRRRSGCLEQRRRGRAPLAWATARIRPTAGSATSCGGTSAKTSPGSRCSISVVAMDGWQMSGDRSETCVGRFDRPPKLDSAGRTDGGDRQGSLVSWSGRHRIAAGGRGVQNCSAHAGAPWFSGGASGRRPRARRRG